MNAEVSEFVICVEAIIYLLLYILHDCTFNCFKVSVLELIISKSYKEAGKRGRSKLLIPTHINYQRYFSNMVI